MRLLAALLLLTASACGGGGPASATKNCGDFRTQAQAQEWFTGHGGPSRDPSRLDTDHDGIACEDLPRGSTDGATPASQTVKPAGQGECDASYPDFCIKPPPPDLNCRDVPQKNFTVRQPDPHGFDRDRNGRGCES
jgi:hypothetical protein